MRSNNDVTNCFARRALRTDITPRIPTFHLGSRNESCVGSFAEKYAYRQVRVKQMKDAKKYAGHARLENPGQETRLEGSTGIIVVSHPGDIEYDGSGRNRRCGRLLCSDRRENKGRDCRN
jgi:hypothetical protein